MAAIAFVVGCLVGVVLTAYCLANSPIGKLKVVWDPDEQQPYMFMEISSRDMSKITSSRYVVLEVDEDLSTLSHQ